MVRVRVLVRGLFTCQVNAPVSGALEEVAWIFAHIKASLAGIPLFLGVSVVRQWWLPAAAALADISQVLKAARSIRIDHSPQHDLTRPRGRERGRT